MHHPSINRAVAIVAEATEAMKTRAFDQDQMDGSLRYVQVWQTNSVLASDRLGWIRPG